MVTPSDLSTKFALDVKGVGDLRQAARENSPESLKATARQFEALFMNMVLKSMREATPQDSMFDSQQTKMYTAMLDQQISQSMASRGIGLAEVLVRQLSRTLQPEAAPANGEPGIPPSTVRAAPDMSAARRTETAPRPPQDHTLAFRERLGPYVEQASRESGIPAKFMLGQAALESGWGRRESPEPTGDPAIISSASRRRADGRARW